MTPTSAPCQPLGLALTDLLGPLPEPGTRTDWHHDGYGKPAYTAEQMLAYAAQEVAAERERCAQVVRDFPHWIGPHAKRELLAAMLPGA